MLERLIRPEYVFRPRALARRLRRKDDDGDAGSVMRVAVPWSDGMWVLRDGIGRAIDETGVFDLPVSEALHRLLDDGDTAVDVGANVGYVTGLMAARVGSRGRVLAFEPYPEIFAVLERNVDEWRRQAGAASLEAHRVALSGEPGTGRLSVITAEDRHNMGLASLRARNDDGQADDFDVELARLDDVIGDGHVAVLKIDVEGHELSVLQGAQRMLSEGRVRYVVFEDHGTHPTPPMTFLEEHGMTIYALRPSPFGLRVLPATEASAPPGWPGPNYLATRETAEALGRLRARGWRALG